MLDKKFENSMASFCAMKENIDLSMRIDKEIEFLSEMRKNFPSEYEGFGITLTLLRDVKRFISK